MRKISNTIPRFLVCLFTNIGSICGKICGWRLWIQFRACWVWGSYRIIESEMLSSPLYVGLVLQREVWLQYTFMRCQYIDCCWIHGSGWSHLQKEYRLRKKVGLELISEVCQHLRTKLTKETEQKQPER